MKLFVSDKTLFAAIKSQFPNVSVRLKSEYCEFQLTVERKANGAPDYDADSAIYIIKSHDRAEHADNRAEVYEMAQRLNANAWN